MNTAVAKKLTNKRKLQEVEAPLLVPDSDSENETSESAIEIMEMITSASLPVIPPAKKAATSNADSNASENVIVETEVTNGVESTQDVASTTSTAATFQIDTTEHKYSADWLENKEKPWTEEEVKQLIELVPLHQRSYKNKPATNWATISKIMGRSQRNCCNKFNSRQVHPSNVKKGHFTEDEDALIRRCVEECGGHADGSKEAKEMWTSLAAEMNRNKAVVQARWRIISNGAITQPIFWTEDMDKRLVEAYELYGTAWPKVAEYVGNNTTRMHCQYRWRHKVDPALAGRNTAPWTDEEVEELKRLVPLHERTQRGKQVANWIEISAILNRMYDDCAAKWRNLQTTGFRSGRFSAAEDALIIERVKEWGDRGMGLWTSLEKELNRERRTIQGRWTKNLADKVIATMAL